MKQTPFGTRLVFDTIIIFIQVEKKVNLLAKLKNIDSI